MKSVIKEYAVTVLSIIGTSVMLSISGEVMSKDGFIAQMIALVLGGI